jgi:Ser/Thr protein kinase RdoA (MazF antagonist)
MGLDELEDRWSIQIAFIRQSVLPHYSVEASLSESVSITRLGQGLINTTYLVASAQGKWVLQQVNQQVFPTPSDVVNNAVCISRFLQQRASLGHYHLMVMQPVPLASGEWALDLGEQGFWRALSYVPESMTLSQVDTVTQARMVGASFGHFSANVSAINPNEIKEVITDFHNLPKRLSQLINAANTNSHKRLEQCQEWVDLALNQHDLLNQLEHTESQLPRRICHNDTKINNMLFSTSTELPLAVIDLDTCMPGYLMYDFGDMVRAFCSPVAEDSLELNRVAARPELILAAAKGYTQALKGIITHMEQQSLWLGVKVMTLMLASRFLTDYLQGDKYFTVSRPEHNLQRAMNQFSLYLSLLSQDEVMTAEFANESPEQT